MPRVTYLNANSINDHRDRFDAHPGGQVTVSARLVLRSAVAGRHVRCCS